MGVSCPDLRLFLVGSCAGIAALLGGWFVYEGAGITPPSFRELRYLFVLAGEVASLLVVVAAVVIRKRLEEVESSEQRFRSLLESAPDAIVITTREGRVVLVNTRAEQLFGYSRAELLGSPVEGLFRRQRPERADTLLADASTSAGHRPPDEPEFAGRRKDGSAIAIEVSFSPLETPDGPLVINVVRDLSARRRAEEALRQSEERFRQLQKMEAVGTLAGGVAHDFNNLLTVILGCTEYLLTQSAPGDAAHPYLQMVKKSGERGAHLTRQLLTFCRKQVSSRQLLDLGGVLAGLHDRLRRLLGDDIQLTTRLAPDLRATRADPAQVEQVVLNLAANARDAMAGGGQLTLATANVDLDEAHAAACPDVQPGPYVLLSVRDTGCGMSAATRVRLFEPFFTTKEVGKGTGLGLATVYGIVRGSGGHIEVESEEGRGTTFRVYLPAEGDLPARNGCPGPPAEPRPGAPAPPVSLTTLVRDSSVHPCIHHAPRR